MVAKIIRLTLVDDNRTDLEKFSRILSSRGSIKVTPIRYSGEPDGLVEIVKSKPDIVFIDNKLDEQPLPSAATPQLGSTVASIIRERLPDCAIELLTRGSLFGEVRREAIGAFDEVLFKEDVADDPSGSRELVRRVVAGYKQLRQRRKKDWLRLCTLLGATPTEMQLLERARPPRDVHFRGEWRVTEAARWIRGTLLPYPGILWDPLHASAALGLSLESFEMRAVQKMFSGARFVGPFAPPQGRWWSGRIRQIAVSVFEKAGNASTTLHDFAAAWNELRQVKVKPSTCIYSSASPAECICYVYKAPVKREYSLPYRPDSRPSVMDEARVSFKAIQESNDFFDDFVTPDSHHLVSNIQKMSTE